MRATRNRLTPSTVPLVLLLAWPLANSATAETQNWRLHSDIDLFAFSEAVSINQFAKDFDDNLVSGETAFTQDKFEIGVRKGPWLLAYVDRFDYLTEFTEDTAFFHHSEQNSNPVPTDREYHLLLDVERARSQGVKIGYSWDLRDDLRIDLAGTYYFLATDLQSGKAEAIGDLDPINEQLIEDINAVLNQLTADNRDLSPILPLIADVNVDVLIDYAFDEPKFGEKEYRKPVFVGEPNPLLEGVDFSAPEGTGYSFDVRIQWQPMDQLGIDLALLDLGHTITWKDAPQSYLSFSLNTALVDALGVAQDFVDGKVVAPNDLIDRQLVAEIFNEDFDQHLPWRADLRVTWSLERELSLLGWTPNVSLLGGIYHTEAKDFPRFGFALDDNIRLQYDFGGDAIHLSYEGKYGFAKLIADDLDTDKAHTFGIALGVNYAF
jgi:hypothetical protein